jgi:16S rRNA (guanine527-N7)-methyltransferase
MVTEWTIGSEDWKERIHVGAESLGITLNRSVVDRFSIHALELMRWNTKINLTAITDPFEVAVKHYIDSIAPADLIPQRARLLDIGSGAGFPGIPLKIMFPSMTATLIDAVRKKVSFLNHSGRTLQLKNFRALHVRIEKGQSIRGAQTGRRKNAVASSRKIPPVGGVFQKNFDVVVARALATLDDVLLMAWPLLARKGRIIALKGRLTEAEIESASRTVERLMTKQERAIGSPRVFVKRYKLPFLGDERSIFAVRFD